jgi:hypothetical protein
MAKPEAFWMLSDEQFERLPYRGLDIEQAADTALLTALFGEQAEQWQAMLHALEELRTATNGKSPCWLFFKPSEQLWPKKDGVHYIYQRISPHIRDDVLDLLVGDSAPAWRRALDQLLKLQAADPVHAPDGIPFHYSYTDPLLPLRRWGAEEPSRQSRRRRKR